MFVVAYVKDYLADKSASMATQVVMFSVLLFGTSGVVLDFGRVYSEHGIMQSYTDQAALAAAAELDREPDSIVRAVNAVFGGLDAEGNDIGAPLTKSAVFSSGADDQFNISHLVFLSDLANDAGAQSSMTGIQSDIVYVAFSDGGSNGDQTTAALEAKYVIAVAEERSVSNTLIGLINSGAETAAASSNVVRTVAAATRRNNFCGDFTNLVMCSRQSEMASQHPSGANSADLELGEFMEAFEGTRYVHIANDADGTEPYRLYRRRNAQLTSLSALETICNDFNQMPGASYGLANNKLDQYQAICHLAAATQRDHCIGDTLEIVRAEPEVITTALNVAFDMWDYPISEALAWEGTPDQPQLMMLQPDLLVYKGKARVDSTTELNNISNYGLFGLHTDASRLHYESTSNENDYNLNIPSCFVGSLSPAACGVTQAGIAPYIGSAAPYSDLQEYYEQNYPDHYTYVNGGLQLDVSYQSFYDLYLTERYEWTHAEFTIQQEEETYFDYATFTWVTIPGAEIAAQGESIVITGEDASLAAYTPSPTQTAHLNNHSNYPSALVSPDDAVLRRRMSVPLVNCSNLDFDQATGIAEVEVLEFIDVFLLQPPQPTCVGGLTQACNNANIASTRVFTEFIEKSVYIETEYPELVR